jgi:hypothetical protein
MRLRRCAFNNRSASNKNWDDAYCRFPPSRQASALPKMLHKVAWMF